MLDRYGYIDRRDQSRLVAEDRLRPIPASLSSEETCRGCAATSCGCAQRSSATSRRPETLSQARTWEYARGFYLADGFCDRCAVQAAYGHQVGFSQVASVCPECHGKRPTYRNAGEHAQRWAGVTLILPAQHQSAANDGDVRAVSGRG
jgi:hypothetical protein